jgi:hypothetical protein
MTSSAFLHEDDGPPVLVRIALATSGSRRSTRSSTATEAWLRVNLLGFVEDADQATATAGRIILRYGPPHPGDAVPRAGARGVSGP